MKGVLLVVGVAAMTAACAIQPDARPRDIPIGDRVQLDPVAPSAGESDGSSRVFLLTDSDDDGERMLRSVPRSVNPPTHAAVIEELFNGPNAEEFDAGFRTALPDTLSLHSARPVANTLNVDVSPEILELPSPALQLAVAEIVFTANELPGVRDVRLRVDGEPRAWPDGRGELQDTPLSVYDFPGLAESTQPSLPAIPSEPVS